MTLRITEQVLTGCTQWARTIERDSIPYFVTEEDVVAIGFLENERWHAHDIAALTEDWPSGIRKELRRQHRYIVRADKAEAKRPRKISKNLPPGSTFAG